MQVSAVFYRRGFFTSNLRGKETKENIRQKSTANNQTTFENARQKMSLTLTLNLKLKTLFTKEMTLLRTNSEKVCKEERGKVKCLINDALNC